MKTKRRLRKLDRRLKELQADVSALEKFIAEIAKALDVRVRPATQGEAEEIEAEGRLQ